MIVFLIFSTFNIQKCWFDIIWIYEPMFVDAFQTAIGKQSFIYLVLISSWFTYKCICIFKNVIM